MAGQIYNANLSLTVAGTSQRLLLAEIQLAGPAAAALLDQMGRHIAQLAESQRRSPGAPLLAVTERGETDDGR